MPMVPPYGAWMKMRLVLNIRRGSVYAELGRDCLQRNNDILFRCVIDSLRKGSSRAAFRPAISKFFRSEDCRDLGQKEISYG